MHFKDLPLGIEPIWKRIVGKGMRVQKDGYSGERYKGSEGRGQH